MPLTIKDLIKHLHIHKDAMILLGPNAGTYNIPSSEEDMNKLYTHRSLKRTPELFWDFYQRNIYIDANNKPLPIYSNIKKLVNLGIVKSIVTQNIDPIIKNFKANSNLIQIHGSTDTYHCQKCKRTYVEEEINTVCSECKGDLRPDVLLYGQRYDIDKYNQMVECFNNTHTIILIGLDFNEDSIYDLIEKYCDQKSLLNNEKLAILIGDIPEGYDLNNDKWFDFIVQDNEFLATQRLIDYDEQYHKEILKEMKNNGDLG